jgi:hypothetical protein
MPPNSSRPSGDLPAKLVFFLWSSFACKMPLSIGELRCLKRSIATLPRRFGEKIPSNQTINTQRKKIISQKHRCSVRGSVFNPIHKTRILPGLLYFCQFTLLPNQKTNSYRCRRMNISCKKHQNIRKQSLTFNMTYTCSLTSKLTDRVLKGLPESICQQALKNNNETNTCKYLNRHLIAPRWDNHNELQCALF